MTAPRDDDDDVAGETLRSTLAPRAATPDTAGRRAMLDLAQLSKSHPARLGDALLVEEAIGYGGMGVVHVATQTAVGRKVAVKMLRPDQRTPAQAMQLLREAWVTGRLEHPSVVPIYDLSLDEGGQPVIVLRRIEGIEWAALLREPDEVRRRFKASDLLEWNLRVLMQVCNAVHFAHQRGILHRDLKPENVMVGELGEVYVLDWGIAVSLADDGSGRLPLLRDATEVAGTPYYMAPEMWAGDPARLGPRTDVYLLGAILYELISGEPPHSGTSLSEVSSHAAEPPRFTDGLPPGLVEICRRALAADPAARPESALAFRREIETYLERRSGELLMNEAERALAALSVELARPSPTPDVTYNLFGASRFGFEQVLARAPDEPRARDGLARVVTILVEHELAADDPKAAAALLASLGAPDAALAERVAAAEREHAARAVERKQLEAIGRQHDAAVGQRTRAFLSLLLGIIWTLVPLLTWRVERWQMGSYRRLLWGSSLMLLLVTALGVWARESMTKTVMNRGMLGVAMFVPMAQVLLVVGCRWMAVPVISANILFIFLWSTAVTVAGIVLERRLLWASPVFIGSWLASTRWPDLHQPLMTLCNFALLVAMVMIWRPRLRR